MKTLRLNMRVLGLLGPLRLGVFREQLAALVSIFVLLPDVALFEPAAIVVATLLASDG